jgi:hypothetical protein
MPQLTGIRGCYPKSFGDGIDGQILGENCRDYLSCLLAPEPVAFAMSYDAVVAISGGCWLRGRSLNRGAAAVVVGRLRRRSKPAQRFIPAHSGEA